METNIYLIVNGVEQETPFMTLGSLQAEEIKFSDLPEGTTGLSIVTSEDPTEKAGLGNICRTEEDYRN